MAKKEKNNFTRAVEWLKHHGVVKDQNDMADRMGTTPTTISRNKHGGVQRPDDDTLRKFNEQFGSIINIDYLRGESKVMLMKDLVARQSAKQSKPADKTASLLAAKDDIIAVKDDMIANLHIQLDEKKEEIAFMRSQLADKDKLIDFLRQQINELRMQVATEKGLYSAGISQSESADRKVKHP